MMMMMMMIIIIIIIIKINGRIFRAQRVRDTTKRPNYVVDIAVYL
jgi:hypothetical protein